MNQIGGEVGGVLLPVHDILQSSSVKRPSVSE